MNFKLGFFSLAFISFNSFGATNFSGKWKGSCVFNKKQGGQKTLTINQSKNSFSLDKMVFDLTKPTVKEKEGDHKGVKFKEVSTYDFKWNSSRTEILTAASWMGWNLSQHGIWSGGGDGYIRLEGSKLITFRRFNSTFGPGEEKCSYFKSM